MRRLLLLPTMILAALTLQDASANEKKGDLFDLCISQIDPMKCFEDEANKGNPEAQYFIGFCYEKGINKPKDIRKGLKWYIKSADQGYAPALLEISLAINAEAIPHKTPKDAFEACKRAADAGVINAQDYLGLLYENGSFLEPNLERANASYQQAVSNGQLDAYIHLGNNLYLGNGIARDQAAAMRLWIHAITHGNPAAIQNLTHATQVRAWMAFASCADQLDPLPCARNAADAGDPKAQDYLGHFYSSEEIDELDLELSCAYYKKAAEQGYAPSQYAFSLCHEDEIVADSNDEEAIRWQLKAAEQGEANAQFRLGQRYNQGVGFDENPALAVEWFTKAAEQGHADAILQLYKCYTEGRGVEKDEAKAKALIKKAASNPDVSILEYLEYMK